MEAFVQAMKLLSEWAPVLFKLIEVFDSPKDALAHLDEVEAKHRADVDRRLGG